jgi:hypothetical protein
VTDEDAGSDGGGDEPSATWVVLGRSVPGTAHLRRGARGQDAWNAANLPGGSIAVAVADGAGTADRSDDGAAAAVDAAVAYLASAADARDLCMDRGTAVHGAVAAAREAVLMRARCSSGDPDDDGRRLACTLAVALAGPDGLWTALRGDCAVVARDAGSRLFTAAVPRSGEYVNQTFFLTDPWEEPFADVASHPPATAFAVLSDGLLPVSLRLADWTPHRSFFDPLFAFAGSGAPDAGERLGRFLASDRVNARTDDDKTVVLAVRRPKSSPNPAP